MELVEAILGKGSVKLDKMYKIKLSKLKKLIKGEDPTEEVIKETLLEL